MARKPNGKAAADASAPTHATSTTTAPNNHAQPSNGDHATDIFAFGEEMLRESALDPAYAAVHGADLPPDQVKRLLVAYVCFYDLGLAAYLSQLEGQEYWDRMRVAAANDVPPSKYGLPAKRWPRVADRRHFRGPKCVEAVQSLARKFPRPEDLIDWLIAPEPGTDVLWASIVMKRAQELPLWGPWASWKVADLLERLGLAPIVFPLDLRLLPKKPRETLTKLGGEPALRELSNHFSRFPAPPRFERGCNLQEIETILCRFGSFLNGTTDVGKVVREIRHSLSGGWGETAAKLLANMPDDGDVGAGDVDGDVGAGDVDGDVGAGDVDEADNEADHHQQNNIEPDAAVASKITVIKSLDPHVIYGAEDNRGPADVSTDTGTGTAITTTKVATGVPYDELIEYEDAVVQGKAIVGRLDAEWWTLCEVLARTKSKYGKQTHKRYFADIGIGCAGERRYSVYGAWKDIFASWTGTSDPGSSRKHIQRPSRLWSVFLVASRPLTLNSRI